MRDETTHLKEGMTGEVTEDLTNEALDLRWKNICFDILLLILVKTIATVVISNQNIIVWVFFF